MKGTSRYRGSAFSRWQRPKPSRRGSRVSEITRSKLEAAHFSRASYPSTAVVTEKPALRRLTSRTRRLRASLSTKSRCCFATVPSLCAGSFASWPHRHAPDLEEAELLAGLPVVRIARKRGPDSSLRQIRIPVQTGEGPGVIADRIAVGEGVVEGLELPARPLGLAVVGVVVRRPERVGSQLGGIPDLKRGLEGAVCFGPLAFRQRRQPLGPKLLPPPLVGQVALPRAKRLVGLAERGEDLAQIGTEVIELRRDAVRMQPLGGEEIGAANLLRRRVLQEAELTVGRKAWEEFEGLLDPFLEERRFARR